MFDKKQALKEEIQRRAKQFSDRRPGRIRGDFVIEHLPRKRCRVYVLPDESFLSEVPVFTDLMIDFDAGRDNWKKVYRTIRVAVRQYLDLLEELAAWELKIGSYRRLTAARAAVMAKQYAVEKGEAHV